MRLDPPSGDALDDGKHVPRGAPALQITRDWVAVNTKRLAKLAAIESSDGAINLGRDLGHELAQAAGSEAEAGGPDLSVAVDREVPYESLQRILKIARDAGARRVELLFTRGAAPFIPAGAPPETGYVLARDFVALPAELVTTDDGFVGAPGSRFGEAAPELIRRESARGGQGGEIVRLGVNRR